MPPIPVAMLPRLGRCTPLWTGAIVGWCLLLAASPSAGQDPQRHPKTPPPTVTASWNGVPIRTLCRRLGDMVGRPVILDRRLDPGTPISLEVHDASLSDVLERIVTPLGASCAILPTSIRIVPGRRAARLVASDTERSRSIAGLPPTPRRLASHQAPWSWADGARPRELIEALAQEGGIDLSGLDDIPHDHLAAAEWPPLPLAERLDLLLAQFDRRVDWSSARVRSERLELATAPLPTDVSEGDDAVVVVQAGSLREASAGRPPSRPGPPRRPPTAGTPTWTLEVAAPLDQLLATVASRLELELSLDREGLRAKGIAPAEIVRLSVKDVDRDTLLDRIVTPLGLRWTIDGQTLRVGPMAE